MRAAWLGSSCRLALETHAREATSDCITVIASVDLRSGSQNSGRNTAAPGAALRIPPPIEQGEKLPAIVSRYNEYFARWVHGARLGISAVFAPARVDRAPALTIRRPAQYNRLDLAELLPQRCAGRTSAPRVRLRLPRGVSTGNWHLMGPL